MCGCAGIGRLASLRCLCPDGRTGSTPVSRTTDNPPRNPGIRKGFGGVFFLPVLDSAVNMTASDRKNHQGN